MEKLKTHTIIVRGLSNKQKKGLVKIAKSETRSVNYLVIQAIDNYLDVMSRWRKIEITHGNVNDIVKDNKSLK